MTSEPRRGELYLAELDEIGQKLVLVVSADEVSRKLAPVVCLVTSTERERSLPTYVLIDPPEGGVWKPSAILCHNVVTLEAWRFAPEPLGSVSSDTLEAVGAALDRVLDLEGGREEAAGPAV